MPATAHGPRRPRPSLLMLVVLMMLWVAMWGDLTPGNLVAGFGIAMLVTLLAPLPRGAKRRLVGWKSRRWCCATNNPVVR